MSRSVRSNVLRRSAQEQPPGLPVYEVHATDADEGVNGEVRYSFLQTGAGNRDWENFRIDAVSGVITTTVKLDREKQALYSVSLLQVCVWNTFRSYAANFVPAVLSAHHRGPGPGSAGAIRDHAASAGGAVGHRRQRTGLPQTAGECWYLELWVSVCVCVCCNPLV